MNVRHIGLVARREVTDYRRQGRVWLTLIGGPLLLTVLLVGPALLGRDRDRVTATTKFSVAVEGDRAGASRLLAILRRSHFVLRPSDEAAADIVRQKALTGLVLPRGVDAAMAANHPVTLTVLDLTNGGRNVIASKLLVETLRATGVQVTASEFLARGAPPALVVPLQVDAIDLAGKSNSGIRDALGLGLSLLLALQCLGLMGLAQERIGGARDKRVLEPILALPIRRRDLLMGAGLASLGAGLVAVVIALGPLAAIIAIGVKSVRSEPGAVVGLLGGLGVGVLAMAVVLVAAGLLVGTIASSSLTGSATTNVVRVTLYLGLAIAPLFDLPTARWFLAVPLIGPLAFARDSIAHGLHGDRALFVMAAATIWAFVFVTRAARTLDSEQGVLRSSGVR